MNFNKLINWSAKLYNISEKLNLQESFELDSLLDKNFPQVLSKLQTYAKEKIAICATNGKASTINIFNQILVENNSNFITNIEYSKKYLPFASIILNLNKIPFFDFEVDRKDYYCFALSEFELFSYFNAMKFDYLLLNNLFIDQKDILSLSEKKKKLQNALLLNSNINLIINADEAMFFKIDEIKNDAVSIKNKNKFFFGFENIEIQGKNNNEITESMQKNDLLICPRCSCKLEFQKRFYSHLGHYSCECGFKRPKLDVSANAKIFANYIFLDIFYKENKFAFKLPFSGLHNAYNALGAIALALKLGIDRKTIANAIEKYHALRAVDEIVDYQGKKIKIKTIKNPTSLSCAVSELEKEKNTKLIICFSDNPKKDGKDTSWIWDSNFKALEGFENKIYIASNRADDMALRLKYANVNPALIVMDSDIRSAVECCYYDLEEKDTMMILTTPSLIDEVYRVLAKKTFA